MSQRLPSVSPRKLIQILERTRFYVHHIEGKSPSCASSCLPQLRSLSSNAKDLLETMWANDRRSVEPPMTGGSPNTRPNAVKARYSDLRQGDSRTTRSPAGRSPRTFLRAIRDPDF